MAKKPVSKKKTSFIKDPASWIIIGLGIFWINTFLACAFRFSSLESSILTKVNGLPEQLSGVFMAITQFGSGAVILVAALLFWSLKKKRLAYETVAAGGFAYILTMAAKELVSRPRPAFALSDIVVRETSAPGLGFPSGHSAVATAVAFTALALLPGKWKILVPFWIVAVMISRLYLGVHAPLDVIGGFGIGLFAYGAVQLAAKTVYSPATKAKKQRNNNDAKK